MYEWGRAPYRDRRNIMVNDKYYISGTGAAGLLPPDRRAGMPFRGAFGFINYEW